MNYQNNYAQPAYNAPAQNAAQDGGELLDGATISAEELGNYDRSYVLLPEGDYNFTVVNVKAERYQPKPGSKITQACKKIILTLRVQDPSSGNSVDLQHNLFMWKSQSTLGMIAQFQDSIGIHKKGEPLHFDWRPEVIIGKTGVLALNHRANQNDPNVQYNNIKKLYPKEDQLAQQNTPTQGGWTPGRW